MEDNETTYLYEYRKYTKNGNIIIPETMYIGITNNISRREKEHSKSKEWHKEHHIKTVKSFSSRSEALKNEEHSIKKKQPTYNIVHNKNEFSSKAFANSAAQGVVISIIYNELEKVAVKGLDKSLSKIRKLYERNRMLYRKRSSKRHRH